MNRYLISISLTVLIMTGCGGGGSSTVSQNTPTGTVTGVEMPETMSVVTAQDGGQVSGVLIDYNGVSGVLHESAGTDYSTDPVNVWVWDESLEPLQLVNEILCYMGQTAADQMVNVGGTGEYTALIDEVKCRQGQNTSQETGQSSGQATAMSLWTVKSTRASNSAPQIVHLWVPPSNEPGDDQSVLVEVTAYAGVSATQPFGSFRMNFVGVDPQGNTTMTGSLFTVDANTDPDNVNVNGKPQFKLILSGTDDCGGDPQCAGTFSSKTNVVFNDGSGTSGSARTATSFAPDNMPGQTFGDDYAIAFDSSYLLREGNLQGQQGTQQICSDRNDFITSVWRYNLYYSGNNLPGGVTAGQRVELNSGFPITVDVNGGKEYGWIGYWGMWLPDSVDTSTLTTVTREEFGSNTSTVYELVQAPGKLIKSARSTVPLASLEGMIFDYFDDKTGNEFQVEYTADTALSDGTSVTSPGFYKTARYVYGQNGRTPTTDLNGDSVQDDNPVDATPASGEWMGLWSEALGGNIQYVGGDTVVTYFKETFVNTATAIAEIFSSTNDPDQDGVVVFECYTQCLSANISQADLDNGNIYVNDAMNVSTPAATYYFRRSDLTLYDGVPGSGGQPVTLASGVSNKPGTPYEWGVATGSFVVAGTTLSNVWEAGIQDVSYRWETGSNDWNKTFSVKEQGSSTFVEFDPPLQISYQFTAADDANAGGSFAGTAYYNQMFLLEYAGQGELWGIPWEQSGDRWRAAFTIADGTLLGNGDMYVVKGVEKEQTMREVALSNCASLSAPTSHDLALPTTADIGTVSITLSGKPVVTEAPAVIEGVVQGG